MNANMIPTGNARIRYFLFASLLAMFATHAQAWGGKGHRLIASLAEERLKTTNPSVMKSIRELVGPGVSLGSLSVCADSIRDFVSGRDKPGVTLPGNCLVNEQEAAAMFPNTGS